MTRRILLHIGSPKCGSTYLQQVMLKNDRLLAANGVRYPHDGSRHPGNAAEIDKLSAAQLEGFFKDDTHTVILSHEDLFAVAGRGKTLADLAGQAGIEVQVLAFLRPFSEFIFGDYSQFMKQHFDVWLKNRKPYGGRGFEQFAVDRCRNLSPVGYFKAWNRLFPEPGLILASHRDIRKVIEAQIGALEGMVWEVPRDSTNPSLRMEDCDRLAAGLADPDAPAGALREAFRQAFTLPGEPDAGKTAERRAWIEALFARQNEELLKEFGFDNRIPTS